MPAKTWEDIETTPIIEYVPLGVFWSGDWSVPEDGIYAQTTGRDRLELLRQSPYDASKVLSPVKEPDLSYAEPGDVSFAAGTLHQVAVDGGLVLGEYSIPDTEPTSLNHNEDLEEGILDGLVMGDDGLELEEGIIGYGENFAIGKPAIAIASSTESANYPRYAFDGNENSYWCAAMPTTFPQWIQVDLGSGVQKAAKKMRILQFISQDALKDFELQGSNNAVNWTTIYSDEGEETANWQDFFFDNNTTYRYYRLYIISSYDNYLYIKEIELMESELGYLGPGTRISGPIDLSSVNTAKTSKISWTATTPANTNIKIETALSTNGGTTWGDWKQATNNQSIPDITANMNLSNARLKTRATLSTTDSEVTPVLKSLSISLTGEKDIQVQVYYDDGYRLSPGISLPVITKAVGSKLTYSATTPAGTSVAIKTSLSIDDGETWGDWQIALSGQAIPGIVPGMDLSNARLKLRQELETEDNTKTPKLSSVTVSIEGGILYTSLYDLAYNVLHDAELKDDEFWIDPELQQFPVPYAYFEPQSHREALRKIAEACVGQVYCDREGIVRVEGPSFTKANFNLVARGYFIQGAPFPAEIEVIEGAYGIGPDDYFSKDNPAKWAEIANYIEVETQPLRPDTAAEVYRSNDPVPINAGQSITITAYYNHTPCIEAEANLVDAPDGAEITDATYYAWGAEINVYSPSTGTFELVINARPLKILNKERAVAKDENSITENGLLKYTFPGNPLVQAVPVAQMIANTILASAKLARRDVELDWRGNPALELGDVIQVPDYQRGSEDERGYFVITRQEIEYNGALRAKLAGKSIAEEGGA